MALIVPTLTSVDFRSYRVPRTVWTAITSADTADAWGLNGQSAVACAVQITGTFGGATVTLQGSNDGTNYFILKDFTGTDVSATSATMFDLSTAVLYVKPVVTGGAGYSINVNLVLRG
jgi:hypothetical protein